MKRQVTENSRDKNSNELLRERERKKDTGGIYWHEDMIMTRRSSFDPAHHSSVS